MVRADRVDGAVGKPRPQRRTVARAAQRRLEPALGVEPAEVDLGQVQVMGGDVAGHRQSFGLRRAHQRDALGRRQPGDVNAALRLPDQGEDRRQRHRLGSDGNPRQPEPRGDFPVVRDPAPGKVRILWPQPDRMPESRRILQRPQQHLRVDERPVGLRERHAAGLGQLAHLGQRLAGKSHRQRPDRVDVRAIGQPRALLEHFDETGLVERRVGVGGAGEAGHAAGHRRVHLRFQRRLVFESGLAQPRGEIDQSRRHDAAGGVEHASGLPARRRRADRHHLAGGEVQRGGAIDPVPGVDEPAVGDFDFHDLRFRRRCVIRPASTSRPSAPRCRR